MKSNFTLNALHAIKTSRKRLMIKYVLVHDNDKVLISKTMKEIIQNLSLNISEFKYFDKSSICARSL